MADPELVKVLRQGSEIWNHWREEHPKDVTIDLSEINLVGADLGSANLGRANLKGSNLSRADLSYADLSYTDLVDVDLRGASLLRADLFYANLRHADLCYANLYDSKMCNSNLRNANLHDVNLSHSLLIGANLSGADLHGVNLSGTHLSDANLQGAVVKDTVFAHIDLRRTKSLAEIRHSGPSHIALDTILLPQDGSALHFLRGCGVSDEWIDFWRATAMRPVQYHSCFISYTHQDEDLARRLHSDLQTHSVRCWFAPHNMKTGDKIRPRIDEAIHLQEKLLLILSECSITSDWVEHEVETALARERKEKRMILFPIRLDNAILEQEYIGWPALVQHERHIGDFTGWKNHDQYQVAFERLLRDLKQADE